MMSQQIGDLISREETLTAFSDYVASGMSMNDFNALWDIVVKMPPANPWIPVSDRLPEESEYCLCCDKDGYIAIGFISKWSVRQIDGETYYGKDWCFDDDEIDIDVVAWMPLPEPYKAESEETDGK